MATTATLQLPYPVSTDTANVPRDVKALADALDAASIAPAGVIQMWPGNTAPTGWQVCDGHTVPAATNPKLAALFGSSGGNVTLPDLRGRMLVGVSGTRPLRSSGGAATVALTTAQLPAHTHPMDGTRAVPAIGSWALVNARYGNGDFLNDIPMRQTSGAGFTNPNATDASGGDGAHENMPPYYAINFIIRSG